MPVYVLAHRYRHLEAGNLNFENVCFGEALNQILGISLGFITYVTRLHEWTIERIDQGQSFDF